MNEVRAVDPATVPTSGTYGWRARVGFITVASTLETPLYELYMMAPPGVAFVSMGLTIRRVTTAAVEDAWARVADASREAAAYHLDHLIVSGAPLAYLRGPGADRELVAVVEAACGVPTTFELTASIDALRHLGAQRIALASPFSDDANERIRAFLTAAGFTVTAMAGLGLDANPDITRLPLEAAHDRAVTAWRADPSADAVYITCPRWPVAPAIAPLEAELGVPVVASVQSALWDTLRRLEPGLTVPNFGRLLAEATA